MELNRCIYVLCCSISNLEAFRLLNFQVFEALFLIKRLLIKKLGVICLMVDVLNSLETLRTRPEDKFR